MRTCSMAKPKIVQMKNVTAWRGRTRAIRDVSLELSAGRSTVILGPNGAGKSTLLKLISREIHPEHREGTEMRLFGKERWNVWELRERLGIVSHDLHLEIAKFAGGRDVILSGYRSTPRVWPHQAFSDEEEAGADAVIDRLGLRGLEEKRYGAMSTGEQRRFLLGRALVNDPDVLVLDEPTSGLDPRACFQYLDIVRGLMRAGKTLLLVTHHLHEIPPEVERVVLLGEGRLVADGEKEALLTNAMLSELFEMPMEVIRSNGYFHVVPAAVKS